MSVLGPLKSLNFYTGSIAVASGFSGTKDVTITAVVAVKSFLMPAKSVGPQSTGNPILSPVGFARFTGAYGSANSVEYNYANIPSATVVRFNGVNNQDSNAHTLEYAFWVVEYR